MKEIIVKMREALLSVLPITVIVYLLMPWFGVGREEILAFSVSVIMLIVGIGLFNIGADLAMTPMGTAVGAGLAHQKRLWLLLTVSFVLGVLITVAEPDLQVLAKQVSAVMNGTALIVAVGIGVGSFLIVGILRIVAKQTLSRLLMLFYMLVFAVALMVATNGNSDLLPVAFDSGGVTTGPITVPLILSLGVGVSHVLSQRNAQEQSFGLVALCSIGPVLAVLFLGSFSDRGLQYQVPDYSVTGDLLGSLLSVGKQVAGEVLVALGLIVAFFAICQIFLLKLPAKRLLKIGVGIVLTYVGLVLFLSGVNVGFMPMGHYLGSQIAALQPWVLVLFGLAVGVLVVLAEPAIHVLKKQVEEVTGGTITQKSMIVGLCVGVGGAIALSMVRIIYDFSIVYYVIPGYFISLALSLFVPPVYTAIAFDSGGVASGPMTSGFLLPFAVGACVTCQGSGAVLRDAFGVVALVAMTPLITIQVLGVRAILVNRVKERRAIRRMLDADDQQIIHFM